MTKRALAVLAAAAILLTAVCCALFAFHACEGEGCRVCALADASRALLKALLICLTARAVAQTAGKNAARAEKTGNARAGNVTPVALRVRMND